MSPRKRFRIDSDVIGSPFLTRVGIKPDRVVEGEHPFTLPILSNGLSLEFTTPVTFLVGENGSGKSSVLEALAWATGFGVQGGSRDHQFADDSEGSALGRALALSWRQRISDGFFLRAETFHQFSTHLEQVDSKFFRYGGKSLHQRSHGEAFLALFEHRFDEGIYLLDEPEAALSPQRQLAFMAIMHGLARQRIAQFIVATHSPILLCLPGARVLSFEDGVISETDYQDTEHYRLTREFLMDPSRYLRHLLAEDEEDDHRDD
ncbi:MAG: AAA family ATPase [Gemmatimonadaceae bacterium]|nr:AAA family ATPase [Gemmatimonadaceae bacterium]